MLTTYHSDGYSTVMFFPIPTRYACWAELVLIQMMVPNASFTGHLAGILVGVLYVAFGLKKLVKFIDKLLSGDFG